MKKVSFSLIVVLVLALSACNMTVLSGSGKGGIRTPASQGIPPLSKPAALLKPAKPARGNETVALPKSVLAESSNEAMAVSELV